MRYEAAVLLILLAASVTCASTVACASAPSPPAVIESTARGSEEAYCLSANPDRAGYDACVGAVRRKYDVLEELTDGGTAVVTCTNLTDAGQGTSQDGGRP